MNYFCIHFVDIDILIILMLLLLATILKIILKLVAISLLPAQINQYPFKFKIVGLD